MIEIGPKFTPEDGYARRLGRLEMRVELEIEAIRKLLEGRT